MSDFNHEISVKEFESVKETQSESMQKQKSVTLSKFAPLFAQKTAKDNFDSLSKPKFGSSMNIPKEALTQPLISSSPRDDMIKIMDQKFKRAALNKEKAFEKMEREKSQILMKDKFPSVGSNCLNFRYLSVSAHSISNRK